MAQKNEQINAVTLERVDGAVWTPCLLDHLARYKFALTKLSFVKKRVLDNACGTGYGSLMIATNGAKKVIGIDLSSEVIKRNKDNFNAKNLSFYSMNSEELDLLKGSFDIVLSFETIEHVNDYRRFLSEIYRVLKNQGILMISTPNKATSNYNPYHLKEFYRYELKKVLMNHGFKILEEFGQQKPSSPSLFVRLIPRVIRENAPKFLSKKSFYYIFHKNREVHEIFTKEWDNCGVLLFLCKKCSKIK